MVTTEICSPSSSPNVLQCKCCSQKVRLLSVRWSFFKPSTYFLLYGIFGLLGFKNIVFKGYRQRLRKIYRSIRLAFLAITAINTVQVAGGKREKKEEFYMTSATAHKTRTYSVLCRSTLAHNCLQAGKQNA